MEKECDCEVKSVAVLNPEWTCIFCFKRLEKPNDRNLVDWRGKFNAAEALRDLPFIVKNTSRFISTHCLSLLKKWIGLQAKISQLSSELRDQHLQASSREGTLIGTNSRPKSDKIPDQPPRKIQLFSPEGLSSIGKKVHVATQTNAMTVLSKIPSKYEENEDDASQQVSVHVEYESGVREKKLPKSLQSLGKMLVRGTFRQIATAAWHCADLRPHIISRFLRTVHKEMDAFTPERSQVCCEMRKRMPFRIFHSRISAMSYKSDHLYCLVF
eukprot:Seg4306.2 transcript_id=Seg4306.2/GoldUCD/mRNA.D3Y31 product="hypothetical protein" protein_id=Seg4306.2/GoldUCD/D3Y31